MSVLSGDLIQVLREIADTLQEERAEVERLHDALLERAAQVADQVEAVARPGDGKDAAAEIGRRIRALMEETQ